MGYEIVDADNLGGTSIFFGAKRVRDIIYAVSVVNYVGIEKITYEDYNNMLRRFRVYCQDTGQLDFRLLQIVCTYEAQNCQEIISGFYPYWIVDIQNGHLMIYENQPDSFSDAASIIEDTLDGKSYILSDGFGGGTENGAKRGFPFITALIILINAVAFFYMDFARSLDETILMMESGALNYSAVVEKGEYYRIITHFFIHDGIDHLFSNMVFLAFIGYYFENMLGKIQYLVIYMLSGIIAGTVSLCWYNYFGNDVWSVGASGAVFGLCGVMIAYILSDRKRFEDIGFIRIVLFLILTLCSGFGDSGIDNVAHVTGFVLGAIITFLLLIYRKYVKKNEKAGT